MKEPEPSVRGIGGRDASRSYRPECSYFQTGINWQDGADTPDGCHDAAVVEYGLGVTSWEIRPPRPPRKASHATRCCRGIEDAPHWYKTYPPKSIDDGDLTTADDKMIRSA